MASNPDLRLGLYPSVNGGAGGFENISYEVIPEPGTMIPLGPGWLASLLPAEGDRNRQPLPKEHISCKR